MSRHQKIIPLGKFNLYFAFGGSLFAVAMGYGMYNEQYASTQLGWVGHLPGVHVIGAICMVFFGITAVVSLRKLSYTSPGLILREDGIVDNASGVGRGLIPWSDIVNFEVTNFRGTPTLIIHVTVPEDYIARGGVVQRHANRVNYRLFGSPIVIESATLEIDFHDLLRLCKEYREKFGPVAA